MQLYHPEPEEDRELFEHYRFKADPGQQQLRIDLFLITRIENASRNKIQQAAKAGNIRVNGKQVKQNYKVKPGDEIVILMETPKRDTEIIPEKIPLDILFEDSDLLIVNKPAGMVVHPAYSNYTGTLVNALAWYLQNEAPDRETGRLPYLVHRIDKDTSGILLIAKNEEAQTKLARQFYEHSIDRRYEALLWGDFDEDEGTIEGNIARSTKDRKIYTVYEEGDAGKHAVTHYSVKERFGYVTLVECRLETGRTHQIRVHFKHIRHPLFGDKTYGGDRVIKGTTFTKYKQFVKNCFEILPRQALHARTLRFTHPSTGEDIEFTSDLPLDMEQVLDKWRNYVRYRQDG
jgi:23S rRNA pseudouridine1911/1915/1917 synthase